MSTPAKLSGPPLPGGATAWEVYKRLGDVKQRTGDGVRRSLVLFFALYLFFELVAAAQVSGITIAGVKITDVDALLTLIPVLLALVLYEQLAKSAREYVIMYVMRKLGDTHLENVGKGLLECATPGTITTGDVALNDAILRPKAVRQSSTRPLFVKAAFAIQFVLPVIQVMLVFRTIAVLQDRPTIDTWVVLIVVAVIVIVGAVWVIWIRVAFAASRGHIDLGI